MQTKFPKLAHQNDLKTQSLYTTDTDNKTIKGKITGGKLKE